MNKEKSTLYIHGFLCAALLLFAYILAAVSCKPTLLLYALPPIPGYLFELWRYIHS